MKFSRRTRTLMYLAASSFLGGTFQVAAQVSDVQDTSSAGGQLDRTVLPIPEPNSSRSPNSMRAMRRHRLASR